MTESKLSLVEASGELRKQGQTCSESYLRKACVSGALKGEKAGGRWVVAKVDLWEWRERTVRRGANKKMLRAEEPGKEFELGIKTDVRIELSDLLTLLKENDPRLTWLNREKKRFLLNFRGEIKKSTLLTPEFRADFMRFLDVVEKTDKEQARYRLKRKHILDRVKTIVKIKQGKE